MTRSGRRRLAIVLFVAFIVVPLIELYVLIQVGQVIGAAPTIVLLVVDSLIGAWLLKREWGHTWRALRTRIEEGGLPTRELADGALVTLGGALMLSPGFVTDILGVLLILPPTRPVFRRLVIAYAASRATVTMTNAYGQTVYGPGTQTRPGPAAGDAVVRGEVIDDEQ
ncbi:FxsA family protein [Nocardioides sp. GY 10113]|uniref:FxsA family protein n=1 Tax=Nocardioides sp. GY 10113 TaxID=2569761 RepID=UPI0010A8B75D|nr:FxsA family protein [Nocardioides sp. GY 10113]TIC87661.1 FxsA family protein [Nocardioides sp. GY 10113]